MAVCVKELYPSEYYQRMEYELNSGNDRNSYIMASLALLQDFRLREKNISHNSARSFTSINPLCKTCSGSSYFRKECSVTY